MQVAVADMAEPDHLEVRVVVADDAVDVVQEGRHLADGDRDVVLVRGPVADGLGDVLAQLPQVLQLLLALAHHAVQHPALLDAVLEGLQGLVGHFLGARLELQQRVERAIGVEGRRHVATGQDLGQGLVGEELEGGQVQLALEGVQYRHDRVEVRGAEDHRGEVLRRALQAHGRFHDKSERTLGADKQLAHVIAGGVLDQVAVQLQQLAGAGDHFQAGHPVAGHAVADHLDAAGIGADVAAQLAGARGGEVHRVVQALILGVLLQLLGHHARLAHHGAVVLVEGEDLVHIVERDDHFPVGRHGGGGQAGTAAGGHQGDLVLVGPAHDGLHLLDGLGEDDGGRCRGEVLGPILAVGVERIGIGQHLAGLHQGLQLVDQGRIGHLGTLKRFMVTLRTLHRSGVGVSRGAYASIRTPSIVPPSRSAGSAMADFLTLFVGPQVLR